MSVTFYPEQHDSDITGWALQCSCGANRTDVLSTVRDEVVGMLLTHTPACADEWCDGERGWVTAVVAEEAPEVNVSNLNARYLLDALGLNDGGDLCGTATGEDFLGRILMALAVAPVDEGVPAHAVPGAGARWVECGRRPGYLQEVLGWLHEVAEWAIAHDRKVVWA